MREASSGEPTSAPRSTPRSFAIRATRAYRSDQNYIVTRDSRAVAFAVDRSRSRVVFDSVASLRDGGDRQTGEQAGDQARVLPPCPCVRTLNRGNRRTRAQ